MCSQGCRLSICYNILSLKQCHSPHAQQTKGIVLETVGYKGLTLRHHHDITLMYRTLAMHERVRCWPVSIHSLVQRAISGLEPKLQSAYQAVPTAPKPPDRGSCRTAGHSSVSIHGRGHLLAVIFLLLWGARLSSGIAAV